MTTNERLLLKLLSQSSTQVTQALADGLCGQPDRQMELAMVRKARETLEEFEEGYAAEIEAAARASSHSIDAA